MESTAELFLEDGFAPAGEEEAAEGGASAAGEGGAPQQQGGRIVQIEEID